MVIRNGLTRISLVVNDEFLAQLDKEVIARFGSMVNNGRYILIKEAWDKSKIHAHTQKNLDGLLKANKVGIHGHDTKYKILINKIKMYVNQDNNTIAEAMVKKLIRDTMGHDARTIRKYFRLLQEDWILLKVSTEVGILELAHNHRLPAQEIPTLEKC